MTTEEFKTWWGNLIAAFPSVDSWLRKIPMQPRTDDPNALTQRRVLQHWAQTLRDTDLDEATRAINELYEERIEMPKDFGKLPFAVKRWCRGQARPSQPYRMIRSPDGELTYRCLHCMDTGMVVVWHFVSMEAARKGQLSKDNAREMAVPCSCSAGTRFRREGVPVFDKKAFFPSEGWHDSENVMAFDKWIRERNVQTLGPETVIGRPT